MATLREAVHKHLLAQAAAEREAAGRAKEIRAVEAGHRELVKKEFCHWLRDEEGIELDLSRIVMKNGRTPYRVHVSLSDERWVSSNGTFASGVGIMHHNKPEKWRGHAEDYYQDCSTFAAAAAYALGLTLASFEDEDEEEAEAVLAEHIGKSLGEIRE